MKITKKNFKENVVPNILRKLNEAKTFDRLKQILNVSISLNKIYNKKFQPNFDDSKWKDSIAIVSLLKSMQWYKDQLRERQYMIQAHATFCCPVTGEILDMGKSFIVADRIISEKGLIQIIDKNGMGSIKHINT